MRPESALAENFLGVPESTEKEEVGMIMLVVKAEPEILRQSVQWHTAYALLVGRVRVRGRGGGLALLAGSPEKEKAILPQ